MRALALGLFSSGILASSYGPCGGTAASSGSDAATTTTASSPTTATASASAAPPGSATGGATPGKYPQGSTRALTEGEVSGLSCDEQSIMKNEIYARHGHKFKNKKLADHFAKESWYQGTSDNVEATLSKIEVANVALIDKASDLAGCKVSSSSKAPGKCKAGEHYDDLNKKCRAFGDCPTGYHWNEPMKTCIVDM